MIVERPLSRVAQKATECTKQAAREFPNDVDKRNDRYLELIAQAGLVRPQTGCDCGASWCNG